MKLPYIKSSLLILSVLFADQFLKFWVKLHMTFGEELHVLGHWALIRLVENNGMAFGMELGGDIGKLILSLFRIVAVCGIGYALHYLIKNKFHFGLVISVSLIFGGALGNIIDSAFYGLIFSETDYYTPGKLVPLFHGYANLFHGKVVDMLYFPLLHGVFPHWVPFWGGEEFIFFRPVFNLADSAISIGVALLLIFQKHYYDRGEFQDKSYLDSEIIEE